jgi:hypothetical protein
MNWKMIDPHSVEINIARASSRCTDELTKDTSGEMEIDCDEKHPRIQPQVALQDFFSRQDDSRNTHCHIFS